MALAVLVGISVQPGCLLFENATEQVWKSAVIVLPIGVISHGKKIVDYYLFHKSAIRLST